jgi:hypothetical protein
MGCNTLYPSNKPMTVPIAYPRVEVRIAGTNRLVQPLVAAMPATVDGPARAPGVGRAEEGQGIGHDMSYPREYTPAELHKDFDVT